MKSGFISIIGRTNAGKSSLINALSEAKLSLISHKQNSTRRRLKAIVMYEGHQLILIDTPGLCKSTKSLNQKLVELALKSMNECDLVLFVASIFDEIKEYELFLQIPLKVPHIVLLNKVDLASKEQILQKISVYAPFSEHFKALLLFSCKQKSYKKPLLEELSKHLPEHPYFFDPEFLTDTNEKDLFRDFILEALFENFSAELPYACEVFVQTVVEEPKFSRIEALIITDTASHKAMLIGKEGAALKRLGQAARRKIAKFSQKKIMLSLFVQVKKNWQKDEEFLKKVVF
ncbi:GTPase Era [Campylobacter troglodytis]|uniref:GTPase Era n=1 Tax=Campylobacter troglodytis TaxID=654363 RepID=UPI001159AB8C|nr:GTPase Era [Campylobacter troglodytis]TQR53284.1 GTPase Era [Campylobacter troglodytis]